MPLIVSGPLTNAGLIECFFWQCGFPGICPWEILGLGAEVISKLSFFFFFFQKENLRKSTFWGGQNLIVPHVLGRYSLKDVLIDAWDVSTFLVSVLTSSQYTFLRICPYIPWQSLARSTQTSILPKLGAHSLSLFVFSKHTLPSHPFWGDSWVLNLFPAV